MNANLLAKYFSSKEFDIRKTGNGRWLDQKCAMDSISFVADCIVEFVRAKETQTFTSPEIWKSEYAIKNVQLWFCKPDPLQESTMDEFNKFFRQPMKMLAASGVLSEKKVKGTIKFTVENIDVLEYVALREKNSFEFLTQYIEKTLKDSGLWDSFETFFDEQTKPSLGKLKEKFAKFCIDYTRINTNVEANRIFIKAINPLACKYQKKGTVKGRISNMNITFDKITYNQANWRDVLSGKEKNVARRDFSPGENKPQLYQYKVAKAKKNLRRFNDKYNAGKSEITDKFSIGEKATHMHHMFPQNEYPQIADYIENLIALTSGQHLQKAHPNGKTLVIDKDYQYICLINKTESIRKNLVEDSNEFPTIYDFKDFMTVLDIGLEDDHFSSLPLNDFSSVVAGIEINY